MVVALIGGCVLARTSAPASPPCPERKAPEPTASAEPGGDLVIVGRILTMDEPPVAEALLVEDGLVACVGARDDVVRLAGDSARVIDIGNNVAYPGFIDAHAHWIGDREYYGVGSAEEAMDLALSHGWTSISEQWVNPERLDELTALANEDGLRIRVDAYLALNFGGEFFGDWYADREPADVGDRLRVRGLKIHLDDGAGEIINWEQDELTATIGRANELGWQISVHSVSTEAQDMVLDAYEAAIGPGGPNPLHHRVEHLIQVSDDQLDRIVAMDLVPVVHPDGGAVDWVLWNDYMGQGDAYPAEHLGWLTRMRDFIESGLHVAAATDMPWFVPDFELTDDISRPHDQIAGGMDGVGREYPQTTDWILQQLLTADQGLRAVTVEAAYALGDEAQRGHLAPGTLGDVTILSGDVLDATPDEIRAMSVIGTVVGGAVEYCGDAEVCGSLED
ncbi:MAG: amidohydrolase family protein [Chloroflexota bacterium]|nr:amidohydrolase family protein [Chloroflexota bacterium]